MSADDDGFWRDLAVLDPSRHDAPPAPGGARYAAIYERATAPAPGATPAAPAADDARPARSSARRWPRRVALAAAVAIILGGLGVVVTSRLGGVAPASAAELVTDAARATGDVSSFRGRLVVEEGGVVRSSDLVVDGADLQVRGDGRSSSFTVVGDRIWEGGSSTPSILPPEGRLAPFAPSSEAVVLAALRSGAVTDVGAEEVRGQATRHYRIELDDTSRAALGELTPGQLAWFELEYPEQAQTVDVWVGDGLIRRIRVASESGDGGAPDVLVTTTEFFDFGADVTVVPPG